MLNHCGAPTGCQPQHGPIYAHAAPHGSIHAPVALPHRIATESPMHLQPYQSVNGVPFSPRYGIAFVPDEPCWVTALAQHCVAEWEAIRVS